MADFVANESNGDETNAEQPDNQELFDEVKSVLDEAAANVSFEAEESAQDDEQNQVDPVQQLKLQLDERTEDLQRLQAEYVNYKKRVDRDRALARQRGIEDVVEDIIPVFDAIDLAKQHEEVSEGFLKLEELLINACKKNGLVAFGVAGDVFDPHIHEAMMSTEKEGIEEPVCAEVFQKGYLLDERVLRPARVVVAMPAEPVAETVEE